MCSKLKFKVKNDVLPSKHRGVSKVDGVVRLFLPASSPLSGEVRRRENKPTLILILFLLFTAVVFLFPKKVDTTFLQSASATLASSRLSFKGSIDTPGIAQGSTTITIDNSGGYPDVDNYHVFPNDTVCFPNAAYTGCKGNRTYTVGTVINDATDDKFTITNDLETALLDADWAVASQSGQITVAFTTVSDVSNGSFYIKIQAATSNYNDGIPDNTGFDKANVATSDIADPTCTGGCGVTWGSKTLSYTSGWHTITYPYTGTLASGKAISLGIGSTATGQYDDNQFINPAPESGHARGTADDYSIDVEQYDNNVPGSGILVDNVTTKVVIVEAVLVSATVEETLAFTVTGVGTGQTACNQALDITTLPYAVPWGSLLTADSFLEGAHQLTVSTNADNGYTVKIEENDQMGKGGTTCDVPTADTADETDSPPCIKDTVCGATACSESAARDWTVAGTYHGLGISLQDVDGTDAVWDYDGKPAETTCTSGTFCTRQIADQQAGNTKATIMTNGNEVSSKDIYVCYRLTISATQPAGYYYNKVKYTATPTF